MVKENKGLIVGLDIGSSKVTCVVAKVNENDQLTIIGADTLPMKGIKRGVVANMDMTVEAISNVVKSVSLTTEIRIQSVYTGISGSHIRGCNSNGMVAIKEREVTESDVHRVLEVAKAMPIPTEQSVLHVMNQEYIIDGQGGVRHPVGMSGIKLESKVHIITAASSASQNILKCIRRCGLEVVELIAQPLASSYAVLSEDEKELGVCMLDIGAGTTDIAVFVNGALRHTAVLPVAGVQITNDIALALRTPTESAEQLKLRYGYALHGGIDGEEMISVPGVGDRSERQLSRKRLVDVVEPRLVELFEMVQGELRRSGYEELINSGIVVTGGTALLPGITQLAEELFNVPVRIGMPLYQGPLNDMVTRPEFSSAMGMVMGAFEDRRQVSFEEEGQSGLKRLLSKWRRWVTDNF